MPDDRDGRGVRWRWIGGNVPRLVNMDTRCRHPQPQRRWLRKAKPRDGTQLFSRSESRTPDDQDGGGTRANPSPDGSQADGPFAEGLARAALTTPGVHGHRSRRSGNDRAGPVAVGDAAETGDEAESGSGSDSESVSVSVPESVPAGPAANSITHDSPLACPATT